jgi:hypothetical protein
MARTKNPDGVGNAEGAFGKEKPEATTDPLTVSGATPGSTPAPGKSKSPQPHETDE